MFCVHNLCLTADTHKYNLTSESSFSCQNEKITSWALFHTLWLIIPVRETGCQYITLRAPSPDLKLEPPHTSVVCAFECERENVVYDLWEGSKDLWECMWVMVGPSCSWCVCVCERVCVQVQMTYGRVQWLLWWRGVRIYGCAKFTTLPWIQSRPLTRERDWHTPPFTLCRFIVHSVCVLCVIYVLTLQNGEKNRCHCKNLLFIYLSIKIIMCNYKYILIFTITAFGIHPVH